jgi:hypothetical protein
MGTRRRTSGRLQVEALETRWTPGGLPGGVVVPSVAACHVGEEIPQVQVASVADGSNTIRAGQEGNATGVVDGSKPGVGSGANAGVASPADGSKPGIASGSNAIPYGQETNADSVADGSKPGVASGTI